jgi:hypothetical protein
VALAIPRPGPASDVDAPTRPQGAHADPGPGLLQPQLGYAGPDRTPGEDGLMGSLVLDDPGEIATRIERRLIRWIVPGKATQVAF